jgi:hypothetical protein
VLLAFIWMITPPYEVDTTSNESNSNHQHNDYGDDQGIWFIWTSLPGAYNCKFITCKDKHVVNDYGDDEQIERKICEFSLDWLYHYKAIYIDYCQHYNWRVTNCYAAVTKSN